MTNEKLAVAIARVEEQISAMQNSLSEHNEQVMSTLTQNTGRLTSLEHSRTRARTGLTLTWAALVFVGWEAVRGFFTGP